MPADAVRQWAGFAIGDAVLLGARLCAWSAPPMLLPATAIARHRQADQQHLGGMQRTRRYPSPLTTPSGASARPALCRPLKAFAMPRPRTFSLGYVRASLASQRQLQPREPVREIEQVLQRSTDRRRSDTVHRGAPAPSASPCITASRISKQSERSTRPSISRTVFYLGGVHTMCDRLVKRDSASHAAVGGSRQQLQRCGAIGSSARARRREPDAASVQRPLPGAGRSVGSATRRSPVLCGSRSLQR